jgi:hypothetical protein
MASNTIPFAGSTSLVSPEEPRRAILELEGLIDELSRRIQVLENMFLTVRHVAPEKPRVPLVAYADGVHWNPGGGEGYYEFRADNLWHKL